MSNLLGFASAAAFTAVGVAAFVFWCRRRDRSSLWAVLCFGTWALVPVGRGRDDD